MDMIPATSTTIRAVGYNPFSHTMRVEFLSGGTYDYYGVDEALYEQMLSPSPWRRLNRLVQAHPYQKVG